MVKTYIVAPNWSTAPPPEGPIKLGHILDDLTEFVPINRHSVLPIPQNVLNPMISHSGFTMSRDELVSGKLGVFAKILGMLGVGASTDISYTKDQKDVMSIEHLQTASFDPTESYIKDSMDLPDVRTFMQGCRFKVPVYMVTGLKIGRGVSLKSSTNKTVSVKMEAGLNIPGSSTELGPRGGYTHRAGESQSLYGEEDFIVAFRVRKIWYQVGELKNKAHNEKVVMQDGTATRGGPAMTLCWDDGIQLDETSAESIWKDIEGSEDEHWLVPKID